MEHDRYFLSKFLDLLLRNGPFGFCGVWLEDLKKKIPATQGEKKIVQHTAKKKNLANRTLKEKYSKIDQKNFTLHSYGKKYLACWPARKKN